MNCMEYAREEAAQCWCDPETEDREMDVMLADAIAKRIAGWMEVAAQNQRNTDYYRGLVERCGRAVGREAYIQDDGGVCEDVLCAKVPELVERMCIASPCRAGRDGMITARCKHHDMFVVRCPCCAQSDSVTLEALPPRPPEQWLEALPPRPPEQWRDKTLRFNTCPKCGSGNWTATADGAMCLQSTCDWAYKGNIYVDPPEQRRGDEPNPENTYVLERDDQGYACAISHGGYWLLHLQSGTTRNEANAQWLVDALNQIKGAWRR